MVKPVVVEVKDNHRGLMYELPDPPAASEWTCDESWETDAATPVSAPSPPWEASPSVAPSPPPEVAPAVESMLAPLPLQGVDDKTFFAIAFGVAYTGQSGYRRYFSVPNELAVWAFSLQKPEIASFHRHIEPGPRPPGTRGKTCPSTLRCDVFERDRTMLWHELTDFLDKWGEPQALLFTKVAPTARECIRWLAATAHANDTLSDRVLLADQLAAGILLKKQAQCDGQKLSSRVKVLRTYGAAEYRARQCRLRTGVCCSNGHGGAHGGPRGHVTAAAAAGRRRTDPPHGSLHPAAAPVDVDVVTNRTCCSCQRPKRTVVQEIYTH
eukprot:TRINITY_DN596_c0_g1_i3.p1 TRINITY_DN596_c0_g1~~TRINITY_DN596_c0_g1_i3.p1  ORF type:complete len:370 (+),score=37.17 TRINITY_DN596_c0_g1_i3:137-1111(+)